MNSFSFAGTGISGLDIVIDHLRLGDNVIWQTDSIEDYAVYAQSFAKKSIQDDRKVIYINFKGRDEILHSSEYTSRYTLDPNEGFEDFTIDAHNIIQSEGVLAFYVFDCLSCLLDAWASDSMVNHFLSVTGAYLHTLDSIAYFALLRDRHSDHSLFEVRESAQVVLSLYNMDGALYIHPLKAENRYSPTMFLPHLRAGADLLPLTSSSETSKLFSVLADRRSYLSGAGLTSWDVMFIEAADTLAQGSQKEQNAMLKKILNLAIARDEKILALAKKYFTLEDVVSIGRRIISSGYIGGKAVGMLLARKILVTFSERFEAILEPHDSYYVGSDVFYTYIIENGLWELFRRHRKKEYFFQAAGELREKLLNGCFSQDISEKLIRMLQYFGQSPIIVRSSSLLEDSYGNAFAGKYESIFLVNQGTLEQRLEALEGAVRKIYASAMGSDALTYRKKRSLEEKNEQMSLLIQRVSGDYRGEYFYPLLAGVGLSKNTYAWDKKMHRDAGLLRLVFGLGTRAVNRIENDYSRIMALDFPKTQLLYGASDIKEYSQHYADVLHIPTNTLMSEEINSLIKLEDENTVQLIARPDFEAMRLTRELGISGREYWIPDFENLIDKTQFINDMSDILKTLEEAYGYPVDIEFTANLAQNGALMINLLQCRPLQTAGIKKTAGIPSGIKEENILFKAVGNFMGGNIYQSIDSVIYIDPEGYSALAEADKYQCARIVGKALAALSAKQELTSMAIAPGRWGTTTASLGVPVSFSEISRISVLCELEFKAGGMTPELSYGSHFFQDLVEENIFYAALFSHNSKSPVNLGPIERCPNLLGTILPEYKSYEKVIRLIKPERLVIVSDTVKNQAVCFEE